MSDLSLDKLDEYVPLQVFALTDVYTVISLSQVNRYFNAISSAKQLWPSLVRDLSLRGLIDVPLEDILVNFSPNELIGEVKRAVVGPLAWSPESATAPTLMRQFTIPFEVADGSQVRSYGELLRGGRYTVFRTHDFLTGNNLLECWELATGCRVWTCTRTGFIIVHTAFQVCRGSKAKHSKFMFTYRDAHLLFLEVDLETVHSRELFQFHSALISQMNCASPQIEEDYIGFNLMKARNNLWITILMNWRSEEYIVFDIPSTQPNFFIVPGHIIFHKCSTPGSVRIYPISSLQRIWRPVSRFDLQDPVLDIQIIPEITVPVTGTVGPIVMITGCPTAPNPFICRRGPLTSGHLPNVEETDIAPDGTINHPIGTVSTHRLSYCTSTNTLEFTLQSTLPQPRHSGQISRAGYMRCGSGRSTKGSFLLTGQQLRTPHIMADWWFYTT
ncbi:hypothetical protein B0H13DRAFT_2452654 [Mycena leptocephala]|nr:hypothetical protein B0H13DRAFT_2452654 [Mycena leptocephala]